MNKKPNGDYEANARAADGLTTNSLKSCKPILNKQAK